MKVCTFGLYAKNEARNHNILNALRQSGVEIVDCSQDAIKGRSKQETFSLMGLIGVCLYYIGNYAKLITKYWFKTPKHDAVLVLFPGYLDMFLIKLISRKPVVYSIHISLYDSLVDDRKLITNPILAKACHWIDKYSCKLSNIVILDTLGHIKYFCDKFNLKESKFRRVFIGADETIFYPKRYHPRKRFTILSYGKFVPLQGLNYVVEAMIHLPSDTELLMVGKGQTKDEIVKQARKLCVSHKIRFIDWMEKPELTKTIANSDICIGGQFGSSDKAKRVISIKAYEMMAMGKPIIVSNTPGMNELFTHKENCYMCESNAKSIANAISELKQDKVLRETMGRAAYFLYRKRCSTKKLGRQLKKIIKEVL